MNRKVVFAIITIAVFAGTLTAWYLYNKRETGPASEKASFNCTTDMLFDDFHRDEQSAGMKYNDRYILVTGRVMETPDSAGGIIHLMLTGNGPGIVACEMHPDYSEDALSLRAGEPVGIRGKCTGIKSVAKDLGEDFSEMLGEAAAPDEISLRNCMVVK